MVNGNGYEIIEDNSYTFALEHGLTVSMKQADEAVGAIMYALSINPTAFDVVYGDDVMVAKLAARPFDGLPLFRIFFRPNEEKKRVILLHIDHG